MFITARGISPAKMRAKKRRRKFAKNAKVIVHEEYASRAFVYYSIMAVGKPPILWIFNADVTAMEAALDDLILWKRTSIQKEIHWTKFEKNAIELVDWGTYISSLIHIQYASIVINETCCAKLNSLYSRHFCFALFSLFSVLTAQKAAFSWHFDWLSSLRLWLLA